jgi:hypothetical protein
MRVSLISIGMIVALGVAMSSLATPAAAATGCDSKFGKAEAMAAQKTDVAKKVKGYQMALTGYQTCTKAIAMADGAARDSMMKQADKAFEESYSYFDSIE